ncbi:MAG: adenosylcobinamide-GDP ribazoletransferase [Pseudomonadota bacterium]
MKTDILANTVTDIRLAFLLLSRLPQPALPATAFDRGHKAVWAYPIVGAGLGGVATLAGIAAMALGLPSTVAAGLVVLMMICTSGALHEDGLADVADGFWGGQTAERRLEIMKDSQIGSYGTLALILVVGLRWAVVAAILPLAPLAIIACATTSRAAMPLLMYGLPHARDTGLSQSVGRPELPQVLVGLGLAFALSLALLGMIGALALVTPMIVAALAGALARRKIMGQTGDVLGALQQIGEITTLCILLAVLQ